MVEQEEWRVIKDYPNYRVSNMGRVQSNIILGPNRHTGKWHLLKTSLDGGGYLMIELSTSEYAKTHKVHVLVLEAFVGPRPQGLVACHNNGNRTDARLANLRWDTRKANADDMIVHGTRVRGQKIHACALTENQVREIRQLLAAKVSHRKIAKQYEVTKSTITSINRGCTWGWLE